MLPKLKIFITTFLIFILIPTLYSQQRSKVITGVISDSTGKAITLANITVKEDMTVELGEFEKVAGGNGCLLMAYTHIAHNCLIGDKVILANCVNLAGHIVVNDYAIIGGVTPVHQFVQIGAHAFIGGGSRVPQDVPPFMRGAGLPLVMSGINVVGLRRRGFSQEALSLLQRAYRMLYREGLNTTQAVERMEAELPASAELSLLIDFIKNSKRGITK